MMAKILLVEDDRTLSDFLRHALAADKYDVCQSFNGNEAASLLAVTDFELIILDWELPGISGINLLKELRGKGKTTPILMLTGKDKLEDKETGLDHGADDYLTKPFQVRELTARVRAMLRRASGAVNNRLTIGNLICDTQSHQVTSGDITVELTPKEFALLQLFLSHPEQVFSAEVLLDRLWSWDAETSAETVKSIVQKLRRKLATSGATAKVENVYGVGYRLTV